MLLQRLMLDCFLQSGSHSPELIQLTLKSVQKYVYFLLFAKKVLIEIQLWNQPDKFLFLNINKKYFISKQLIYSPPSPLLALSDSVYQNQRHDCRTGVMTSSPLSYHSYKEFAYKQISVDWMCVLHHHSILVHS